MYPHSLKRVRLLKIMCARNRAMFRDMCCSAWCTGDWVHYAKAEPELELGAAGEPEDF